MSIRPLVAGFCVVLVGCGSAGDRAAPPGCPEVTGGGELAARDGRGAILAASPDGASAVAVWESVFGDPLTAAVLDGGAWSPAVRVSERGAGAPAAAALGSGRAVVVWDGWDGWDGDRRAVRVATRGADGVWSAPANASAPGGVGPRLPGVAATPSGGALLAWRDDPAGAVVAAVVSPGGAVGPPRAVLGGGEVRDVVPVVDAGGRRGVLWSQGTPDGWVVRASAAAGDGWSAPVTLSAPVRRVSDLRAVAGPGGHVAAVWRDEVGGRRERVGLRVRGPCGAWGPPRTAGAEHVRALGLPRPPGPPDQAPAVAVSADGAVVVAWPQRDGDRDRVIAVRAAPGRAPGPAVPVTDSGAAGAPALAMAPDGTAAAVWEDLNGPRLTARMAVLAPGSASWTGCRTLSPPGQEVASPAVARVGGGFTAVWASPDRGAVRWAPVPR
ncbi:MAG: hypothetical protein IT200_14330 [Thermoleophilia bacterium]|nr:hypothetical protein [Thermoleophilia bacterium]